MLLAVYPACSEFSGLPECLLFLNDIFDVTAVASDCLTVVIIRASEQADQEKGLWGEGVGDSTWISKDSHLMWVELLYMHSPSTAKHALE